MHTCGARAHVSRILYVHSTYQIQVSRENAVVSIERDADRDGGADESVANRGGERRLRGGVLSRWDPSNEHSREYSKSTANR